MGFESPEPVSGDRVICLRNNHKEHMYNGMLGTIISLTPTDGDWYDADIQMDGQEDVYSGFISKAQFNADTSLNFTEKGNKACAVIYLILAMRLPSIKHKAAKPNASSFLKSGSKNG